MDTFEKSLKLIDKYFAENNRHIVEEELSKYDSLNFEGVSFDEYISNFSKHFTFDEFKTEIFPQNFSSSSPFTNNIVNDKIKITFESLTSITVNDFSSNLHQDYTGNNNLPDRKSVV